MSSLKTQTCGWRRRISAIACEVILRWIASGERAMVIGIGVNLNLAPAREQGLVGGFERPAVSLDEVLGRDINRGDFAAALITNLFARRSDWTEKGSDWTVARWAVKWGTLNERVTVTDGGAEITGIARKVDARGFLHIETADGELVRVVSGDAS